MELANRNILVVGLGRTGFAAARFLHGRGATVLVTDRACEEELGDQAKILKAMGIKAELGQHRSASFKSADLIVLSPGVPHTIEPIRKATSHGVPVLSEVELASRFIQEPIIAVTGTNGKTTTTELVGQMLRSSGLKVFVGGNIGNPLIDYVNQEDAAEVVVAEISSFQLDTIDRFRPKVSVLLNITADHLDRYPDFETYADAKIRIFENQQVEDIAVLNSVDPLIGLKTKNIKSKKMYFPTSVENGQGAVLSGKHIVLNIRKIKSRVQANHNHLSIDLTRSTLQGRHNYENACAASLAAFAVGATVEGIQTAVDQFKGLPHRLEYIDTINDSKATNVDGVSRALESFSKPVLLIMGGRDKGSDFRALKNLIRAHVKVLIFIGEAAKTIQSVLGHLTTTTIASSMADAVAAAHRGATAGDVVLLSPGCASFDMYTNYAERGEDFRSAVEKLKE
jgi:UDP-N-acetylmuramoylalanine--D-glutamate ligase